MNKEMNFKRDRCKINSFTVSDFIPTLPSATRVLLIKCMSNQGLKMEIQLLVDQNYGKSKSTKTLYYQKLMRHLSTSETAQINQQLLLQKSNVKQLFKTQTVKSSMEVKIKMQKTVMIDQMLQSLVKMVTILTKLYLKRVKANNLV